MIRRSPTPPPPASAVRPRITTRVIHDSRGLPVWPEECRPQPIFAPEPVAPSAPAVAPAAAVAPAPLPAPVAPTPVSLAPLPVVAAKAPISLPVGRQAAPQSNRIRSLGAGFRTTTRIPSALPSF